MNTVEMRKVVLSLGVAVVLAPPLLARCEHQVNDPFCVQPRGATVGTALLAEYYDTLPEPTDNDTPESFGRKLEEALKLFRQKVEKRYTEGTLQRLLDAPVLEARRGAALALGMYGTMRVSGDLASRLKDGDGLVRRLSSDALWAIWMRADNDANNKELERLMGLRDAAKAVEGLTVLIRNAPGFAEAYNQRAIRHYQTKDYAKSIADCEKTLQLNPHHFGAASGLAQCHLNLRQGIEALKAYRRAFRLNPNLDGVAETIRMLEDALGEEGKK